MAPPALPDTPLTARVLDLARVLPAHAVIAERTAAWLWGVDVLPRGADETTWPIELAVPPGPAPPEIPGTFLTALATTLMDRGWTPAPARMQRLDRHLTALRRNRSP
ncbi:hypothetical protein [Thermomonospora cellulosilytica]|uniref:Uncharacterized protein n=1 Tax=Thermomonospora cellulosilytica TaxID=1411118 RepID=A0A7W3N527_9ACTN|nr:hypothetical protein [Thermomonospora cellulosilytica]MBA9007684.1 hypothetical protein [Thermomonospora cellulosilytica]